MITRYVQNYHWWRPWQQGSRFGYILILPPAPVAKKVDALKKIYDPLGFHICGAHISLTVPLTRGVDAADWQELEAIAAGLKPIEIKYGPVFNVLPNAHGVMLAIEPKAELGKVVAALETAAVFKDAPPRPFTFYPHLTIAEYVDAGQTLVLTEQLKDTAPHGSFRCTHLSYLVPDDSFHFTQRARLKLGR
jgi:hypothetical protein